MERLTAADRLMLWPDRIWPQDIGVLAVLDGAGLVETSGRFRIEDVRRAVLSRLHLVPRFRQLLLVPHRGLGGPMWVDDPAFDLAAHVRVAELPAPGDEASLAAAAGRALRRHLDRSRPLWEMVFLTGMPGGRIGLFARTSHAVADGIAGVATLAAFLDAVPDASGTPARPWTPARTPTARELFTDNVRRRVFGAARAFGALTRPVAAVREARAVRRGLRADFARVPTPPTSLDRRVGDGRRLALIPGDLGAVTEVAHAHGAKVNDVLLTMTAAGLGALLRSRGEPVDGVVLPVYVPVTLRADGPDRARGNAIGQMIVPVPIGPGDPAERLRRIAAATRERKSRGHPALGESLRGPLARAALLRVLADHPVNVTTADIPGPPRLLFLAGARLLAAFPVLPLIANVSLGVGALSYAGRFDITVVADEHAHPDAGVLVAAAEDELRSLTSL